MKLSGADRLLHIAFRGFSGIMKVGKESGAAIWLLAIFQKEGMNRMLSQNDMRTLEGATKEDPRFVKLDIYDYRPEGDYDVPRTTDVVGAVTGVFHDSDGPAIQIAVLDPGQQVADSIYRPLQNGDWLFKDAASVDATVLEPTKDLRDQYNAFQALHENAPYQVRGAIYAETPSYAGWDWEQRFPVYDEIGGTERLWTVEKGTKLSDGTEVQSLNDVEKWVLENHPAYLQGMSVMQSIPSGDFMFTPNPSPEYPQGTYETLDARMEYARTRADALGVELGTETAHDVLSKRAAERQLPEGPSMDEQDREREIYEMA